MVQTVNGLSYGYLLFVSKYSVACIMNAIWKNSL